MHHSVTKYEHADTFPTSTVTGEHTMLMLIPSSACTSWFHNSFNKNTLQPYQYLGTPKLPIINHT
jgi:hypothetical protein